MWNTEPSNARRAAYIANGGRGADDGRGQQDTIRQKHDEQRDQSPGKMRTRDGGRE